ncbi:hypothetical protein FHG66_10500 [Rubellimicrobium rubrum]|uniref:DUF6894 domain-containing protein n=1 Tax=Rubellimicrobium rubrum TaxID=2585369 RepID=A0A5C4MUC7_9RHOB|nr:hypothetical protein [Rubellimicrobium rubrum]TNC49543.1 hypothetical protein FHG66_10500 [Rubellimicrobium rubrum]
MPRYFFNIEDDRHLSDQVGVVLPDLEAARVTAVATSGAIIKDHAKRFWPDPNWKMRVTDEQGSIVCDLSFTGTVGAS